MKEVKTKSNSLFYEFSTSIFISPRSDPLKLARYLIEII